MAEAPVAINIDEPPDVLGHLTAQITFDQVATPVDGVSDPVQLFVGQVFDPGVTLEANALDYGAGPGGPNPVYVTKRELNPLVVGNINPSHTGHALLLRWRVPRLPVGRRTT